MGNTTNHHHQARILQCVQLLLGSQCPFQMIGNHGLHWWICSHWASLGIAWPCKADRLGCSLFYSCKYSLSRGRPCLPAAACCVSSQKVPWPLRLMMRLQLVWSPCRGLRDLYGRMQPSMASVHRLWSAALQASKVINRIYSHTVGTL